MFTFDNFLESYLLSNFAPLYHQTSVYGFINIMKSNIISKTKHTHPYKNEKIKMISLTRDKNLILDHTIIDISIELDTHKLKEKYKIIPYDYFIHSNMENKPKSDIHRKSKFEPEEMILRDIENIMDYIISVDFKNDSIFEYIILPLIPILRKEGKIIYSNGKVY